MVADLPGRIHSYPYMLNIVVPEKAYALTVSSFFTWTALKKEALELVEVKLGTLPSSAADKFPVPRDTFHFINHLVIEAFLGIFINNCIADIGKNNQFFDMLSHP